MTSRSSRKSTRCEFERCFDEGSILKPAEHCDEGTRAYAPKFARHSPPKKKYDNHADSAHLPRTGPNEDLVQCSSV